MPSLPCVSSCRTSMTSGCATDEEKCCETSLGIESVGLPGAGSRVRRGVELHRDEPVECVGTGAVQGTCDRLLAGGGAAGVVANSVRRISRTWPSRLATSWVAWSLGPDDPGGARALSRRLQALETHVTRRACGVPSRLLSLRKNAR